MGMCYEDACPIEALKAALKILAAHAYDVDPHGCCIIIGEDCPYKPRPEKDDCVKCMAEYAMKKAWDIRFSRLFESKLKQKRDSDG